MAQHLVLDHGQLGEVRGDGVGLIDHGDSFDALCSGRDASSLTFAGRGRYRLGQVGSPRPAAVAEATAPR
jgi:hypothetical protein